MSALDFSSLSNEQLVELIRAGCHEAATRGVATASAARDAYLSAVEHATVARSATEREAERMRQEEAARVARQSAEALRQNAIQEKEERAWALKKGIAEEASRLFGDVCGFETDGLHVVLWSSRDYPGDRRVFVQYKFGNTLFTYHVTGNSRKNTPPGKCEFGRADKDLKANKEALAAFCLAVSKGWNWVDVDVAAALQYAGPSAPLKDYAPVPAAAAEAVAS